MIVGSVARWVRRTGIWIAEADTNHTLDLQGSIRTRLVHSDRIDYPLLRSWLDSHLPVSVLRSTDKDLAVPHMMLIDCATRTLVAAKPHMQYLALSYVWGTGPPEPCQYPSLPVTLLPTVNDALTATLALGLRYIWIDRYCISQQDPAHKSSQILKMTKIYGNAMATIAAVAGTDPTHGLPGVSTVRPRTPGHQLVGRVGSRLLASGPINGKQEKAVESSVWETRAWTFQEAILSPRIFYFSDLEVSFSCKSFQTFEHLSHPIIHPNLPDSRRGVVTPDGILDLVRDYSSRALTYPSDAFNAIAGVLEAWCAENSGCFHYWALPLLFLSDQPTDRETSEALWNALCWQLDKETERVGDRRHGFPTWSWLLVKGLVLVNTHACNYEERRECQEPQFAVKTGDGSIIDWHSICFIELGKAQSPPPLYNTQHNTT